MTEELKQAAQQALEALSLALSDVDWRVDSPTQPVIHKAYNQLQRTLAQRPAAQADDQGEQLTKAKRLLVDLHKIGGEDVRTMIEARTGTWFVWGQDRASLPTQPAAQDTPEPVGEAVASIYITPGGEREFDDWKHDLPVGRTILYTHSAPGVPEGLQWLTVAEHGMPDFDEEVIGGLWYTDPWLKPDRATRFMWGLCRVLADGHRDFKDGKRWQTFGPSHNDITHWARLNMPALAAAQAKGGDHG